MAIIYVDRGKSARAQTSQYEPVTGTGHLFIDRPTRLERQVGYFLADTSTDRLVPPVPVQVMWNQRLVHQPQDMRLVRTVNRRH